MDEMGRGLGLEKAIKYLMASPTSPQASRISRVLYKNECIGPGNKVLQ